jgi:hypothetical protein
VSPEKTTNLPQAYVAEELYHRKVNQSPQRKLQTCHRKPVSPEKTTNLPQAYVVEELYHRKPEKTTNLHTMYKIVSHNSYKFCRIKMVA